MCLGHLQALRRNGDSVALREALWFKIPSVASDCVKRPKDAIVFKNCDINDFSIKVNDVLTNYSYYKSKLGDNFSQNNYNRIRHIYKKSMQ